MLTLLLPCPQIISRNTHEHNLAHDPFVLVVNITAEG